VPECDEELVSLFALPVALELWPEGALVEGRSWSSEGADLTRRLELIAADGGRLDLRVERVAVDLETGLSTAYLKGVLETDLAVFEGPVRFVAQVEVDVPLALGLPTRASFDGTLKGYWLEVGTSDAPALIAVEARAVATQTCRPAKEVLMALQELTSQALARN
jgi:hypothetical protein